MKKLNAFSLPELLIFLVIVGVISVLMLTIVKPNDKALKYQYYNAYNTLRTAGYNVSQDVADAQQSDDTTLTSFDKRLPNTPAEWCKRLAVNRNAVEGSSDAKYGYINTAKYNCNSFSPVSTNPSDSNFKNNSKVAFQASNSMKYYISSKSSSSFTDNLSNGTTTLTYYLIWVDLNGDRAPNTKEWKEGRPADIVPFFVSDYGEVVPIGYPITDKRYLTASVKYVTDTQTYYSEPMTFYEAQMDAYGSKEYPTIDLFSIRRSFKTKFSSISPKTYPTEKSQDSKCSVSSGDVTPCSVEVDERRSPF